MIRKYEEKDIDELLDAWYSGSLVAHPFLSEDFFVRERKKIPEEYIPRTEIWVYEQNNKVVGFITLINELIYAFFVDTDFQRIGIGRALMEHAKSLRTFLELYVFKENKIGRNFYDKCGFIKVAEHLHEETGFMQLRLKLTY